MAQTHLSYSQFKDIYGDLGVTEWTKYNWLADYWKELTPDGFERVQWLQSDGNQWIDTGYAAKANSGIRLVYDYAETGVSAGISGIYTPAGFEEQRSEALFITTSSGIVGSTTISLFNKHSSLITTEQPEANKQYEAKINYFNNGKFEFGNESGEIEEGSISSSPNIPLFARYNRQAETYAYTKSKIYISELSEGNQYVRYFIPMVRTSDNKPGLYDLINHQFYTNQGLLDFLAGPPVGYTQVEYLESDGNQWIDTGIYGNLNTIVELKVNQKVASTVNTITCFGDNVDNTAAISVNLSTVESPRNSRFGDKVASISSVATNVDHVIKLDQTALVIDNTTYSLGATAAFTTPNHLILFGVYNIPLEYVDGQQRIYYCKINDLLTPVYNLIPTLDSTNRPCMYDLITRQPFYNQGTGEFTWG